MTPEEVLRAYKRQPLIEKRFSQFKSDFEVAPVYLKEATRIQAMLSIYFFVLMLQTLLERELRHAPGQFRVRQPSALPGASRLPCTDDTTHRGYLRDCPAPPTYRRR